MNPNDNGDTDNDCKLYFDKLVILDPVGASWDTIGADHFTCNAASIRRTGSSSRY